MISAGNGEDAVMTAEPDEDGATRTAAAPTDPAGAAALARHAARLRPWRIGYAAGIVALLVAAGVVVGIAWSRGEVSHVTLRTVTGAGPTVALQTPAATLTAAWRVSDTAAIGTPYFRGTIITHDAHTVRGRDARTGRQTWSYTRTDRAVCTAMQDGGLTVAVYRLHGDCDELTALDAGTGARKWTRTLDKDTARFTGNPRFAVRSGTFFFVSATSIYAVAPSGLDFWTFHHAGCTINSAVLGAAGALISQTCTAEKCNHTKFCGNGPQLLLRDGSAAVNDDSKTNKNNPDQITWNDFGSDLVPTVADLVVGARAPAGGSLHLLDQATGKPGAVLPLAGRSDSAAHSAVTSLSDGDLIWIGGRTYALRTSADRFAWQAATRAVPTATDAGNPVVSPSLDSAELAVPTATGLALLNPADGRPSRSFDVTTAPRGSLAVPFGTGFLIAGPDTVRYR
jgi:outer membrane protein assembly factor BamB